MSLYFTIGDWNSEGTDAFGVQWIHEPGTEGWYDTPTVRWQVEPRSGADGSFDPDGYEESITIAWTGAAVADDIVSRDAAIRRLRAASGNMRTGIDLVGHNADRDYWVHGKRSAAWKVSIINDLAFEYQATIESADPRMYSADKHSVFASLVDNSLVTGGQFKFPARFPMGFAGPLVGAGLVVVNNAGQVDTPPVIVINGPTSGTALNLVVYEQAYGGMLKIPSLPANQFVVLDAKNNGVLLMGYQARRDLIAAGAQWFYLPSGYDTLTFSAQNFTDATMQVTWRDAW